MLPPRLTTWMQQTDPGALSLIFMCLAGGMALLLAPMGPLAGHMALHIVLMNAVAPAVVIAAAAHPRSAAFFAAARGTLFPASAAQLAVLWAAHSPPLMQAAMSHPLLQIAVQTTLLVVALWFWFSIVAQRGPARWRAIFALLVTGKLFCLLAAILVFSPRALYPAHMGHAAHAAGDPLADQYLAGLLMLVVCPLTYVFAGVLIAERWLSELRREDARSSNELAA